MIIPRRILGPQALEVSAIGLGCMEMSDVQDPSDEAANLRVLNAALDIGVNFLDTADKFGAGDNERLLAKILKMRRQDVVLATKFGGTPAQPESVRAACDASL